MAILNSSKLRAQRKGAMTVKPFANSTFTLSPFLLEDIMNPDYSRIIARRKYQNHHQVRLPRGMVVHHKDGDPLNNDLSNLEVKSNGEHMKDHIRERGFCFGRSFRPIMERLEGLLALYNE